MFARKVSVHLKPNSSAAFTKQIEKDTIPTLRKHAGFQGELTLLVSDGSEAVAISFWESKEHLHAYAAAGYSEVMKNLSKFIEGNPKVQNYEIANSTLHSIVAAAAA